MKPSEISMTFTCCACDARLTFACSMEQHVQQVMGEELVAYAANDAYYVACRDCRDKVAAEYRRIYDANECECYWFEGGSWE